MTQKVPDIDDILEGINDPDADTNVTYVEEQQKPNPPSSSPLSPEDSSSDCWQVFLKLTEVQETDTDKDMRLVCKIDRELADTLDDCDINGLCRSELVNKIVHAFLKSYLDRMVKFKKEKKSLFQKVVKG